MAIYHEFSFGRGTAVGDAVSSALTVIEENSLKNITRCLGTSSPSSVPKAYRGFAVGCVFINATTGTLYFNTGTVSAPVWATAKSSALANLGTIATTGTTDAYVMAPYATSVASATFFTGTGSLAVNATNYVTFSIVNLGQAGAGTNNVLSVATTVNSTHDASPGLGAIAAATNLPLVLNGAPANLIVAQFDTLRVRATATGTLAGSVASSNVLVNFN